MFSHPYTCTALASGASVGRKIIGYSTLNKAPMFTRTRGLYKLIADY